MSRLVVVGDALLDRDVVGTVERVCPDAPVPVVDCCGETRRVGGAGLAASLAAAAGHDVVLAAPIGRDRAAAEIERMLANAGVELCPLPAHGSTREKTRVRAAGQSLVRLDRGTLTPVGAPPAALHDRLGASDAVLVADYGGGLTRLPAMRAALEGAASHRPVVWDPHVRGTPCTPGTTLVTPNLREALSLAPPGTAAEAAEARHRAPVDGGSPGAGGEALARAVKAGRALVSAWRPTAAAITLGPGGALLVAETGTPLLIPAPRVTAADACGAGDCFAVTAAAALAGGAVLSEAVADAVAAASRFVGRGTVPGRPAPDRLPADASEASAETPPADAVELAGRVRGAGGTVVVAGGCFDLLHRGHVELLRTARDLGDCLVIALNSDASVRQLKGEGRPVQPEGERAAILRALAAVDDVVTFDEPTPAEALRRLRPHLFVKGGDYAGLEVAEQAVLAEWGGQVVTMPYLSGWSTTRIVEEVRRAP